MSQPTDVGQIFNTFVHLIRELKEFAEVSPLKIAFDPEGNVYLIGADFQEQLQSNLTLHREIREELRQIIARRCPRIPPETLIQPNS